MDPLADELAQRERWRYDGSVAERAADSRLARVREIREVGRGRIRWHAAIIDESTGAAIYTLTAWTPDEAITWSEQILKQRTGPSR